MPALPAPKVPRPDRTLLITCGALAREVLALRRLNGWDHLDLICLPATLHNQPARIAPAVEGILATRGRDYDEILVLYADCGTGGALAVLCARHGIRMLPGPHCYALYEGITTFAARAEATSFYLTDLLARQFDALVWRPLGLDRHPDLLPLYFGRYDTLVFLAQTEDPTLTARAKAAADRLGLAFERRFTGYGDLATALERTPT